MMRPFARVLPRLAPLVAAVQQSGCSSTAFKAAADNKPSLASRLAALPRLSGCEELTTYDCTLRRCVVTEYLQYDGLLSPAALEEGLLKAVLVYPVVLGWIEERQDGAALLKWDSHARATMHWSAAELPGDTPPLYSQWAMARRHVLPPIEGRLVAAKASIFPDASKSLLVFSFDHSVFDYPAAMRFLTLWLSRAAAAAAEATSDEAEATSDEAEAEAEEPPADARVHVAAPAGEGKQGERGEQAQAPAPDFSRRPYRESAAWAASAALRSRDECLEWLDARRGSSLANPFPWDSLSKAGRAENAAAYMQRALSNTYSVWRVPRELLEAWKEEAAAAAPLPSGMWYSANAAANALLAAGMYAAAGPRQRAQIEAAGGAHVVVVVDTRGGRCGLHVPRCSETNPSVWGIRVFVPIQLLDEAKGRPTPALMRHIRVALQDEIEDGAGAINKQFEYWEVARRAGLALEARNLWGLPQEHEAEVLVDWLPVCPSAMPTLPGTSLTGASVRWGPTYMDRAVMCSPVAGPEGAGRDIQLEFSMPDDAAGKLAELWRGLGLQEVAVPSRDGGYSQMLDVLSYPYTISTVREAMRAPGLLRGVWRALRAAAARGLRAGVGSS